MISWKNARCFPLKQLVHCWCVQRWCVRVHVCARKHACCWVRVAGAGSAISDCVLHSWNEMFVQKPGQQDRSMSHCDGSLDTIRPKWKGIHRVQALEMDSMDYSCWRNWLWRLCAFIPCFPQRALPLAVKVVGNARTHARTRAHAHTQKHKEKQTETGVSAQVTSWVSAIGTCPDLSSKSRNQIKRDELQQTPSWVRSKVN